MSIDYVIQTKERITGGENEKTTETFDNHAFSFSILADTKNIPHNTKISLQYGTAEASCLDSIGSYWLFGKAYNTNNYISGAIIYKGSTMVSGQNGKSSTDFSVNWNPKTAYSHSHTASSGLRTR